MNYKELSIAELDMKEIARCALERIKDVRNWTRDAFFRIDPEDGHPQYCLLGAARQCAAEKGCPVRVDHDLSAAYYGTLTYDFDRKFVTDLGFDNQQHIFSINDNGGHDLAVEALRAALRGDPIPRPPEEEEEDEEEDDDDAEEEQAD